MTPDGFAARLLLSLPWFDRNVSPTRVELWVRVRAVSQGLDRHRAGPRADAFTITREDIEADLSYGRDE